MMSKKSFLVSMKENNKRRAWVWVLSILAFMLLIPIHTALNINRVMNYWSEGYGRNYGTMAEEMLRSELIKVVEGSLGTNVLIFLCTCIIAIVSAIQGFSWLYSRKKIDFYMGMPVKRKKRFLLIWLNGILIYVIPYALGLLISILIAAGSKAMSAEAVGIILQAFGLHFGVYIGLYHLSILAVMLTGNIVVTGLGLAVLCGYEYMVRTVDYGYRNLFFKYFSWYGFRESPIFSPFGMYGELVDPSGYGVKADAGWIAGMIAFGICVGLLSYICYLKRPAEAAGRAMTFPFTEMIIKIVLVVPAALLLGLIVADTINFNPLRSLEGSGYLILAISLGIIIGCCAIQVIYEFDIKGALHQKRHIVMSGVLTAFIFMLYRYDLSGFDSYVPQAEKVESVAFIPSNYDFTAGGQLFYSYCGSTLEQTSVENYCEQYMELKNVSDVCQLVEHSMEEYNKIDEYSDKYTDQEERHWANATVIYRMKSGRRVYRNLNVNVEDEKTCALLDEIIGSQEFKEGYFMGYSEKFMDYLEGNGQYAMNISYGNTVYKKKMNRSSFKELLEAYRMDVSATDFSDIKESVPIGTVSLEIEQRIKGEIGERVIALGTGGINIYPIYENCVAYLKEHGYHMEEQLALEDVVQIQVINHNSEASIRLRDEQLSMAGAETILGEPAYAEPNIYESEDSGINTEVQAEYVKSEEIEKLIPYIYPRDLVYGRWDNGKGLERDYEVIVYLKSESDVDTGYNMWKRYGFLEGEVPEFVQKDTLYKE